LSEALRRDFNTEVDARAWIEENQELEESTFRARIVAAVDEQYAQKVERFTAPLMRQLERQILLQTLDQHWREHLAAMDYLRQGIHLRGYAQKDYRYEFKREAFQLFSNMLDRVKHDVASLLSRVQLRDPAEVEREEAEQRERLMRALQAQHAEAAALQEQPAEPEPGGQAWPLPGLGSGAPAPGPPPFVRGDRKVGRNDPCPCGSGRKFKQCHGRLSA
jgi:preprotein translocase subunit SecA